MRIYFRRQGEAPRVAEAVQYPRGRSDGNEVPLNVTYEGQVRVRFPLLLPFHLYLVQTSLRSRWQEDLGERMQRPATGAVNAKHDTSRYARVTNPGLALSTDIHSLVRYKRSSL